MTEPLCAYQQAHQAQNQAIQQRRRRLKVRRRSATTPTYSATQRAGHVAEEHAALALAQAGLRLLERNLRCKTGEIDLIAQDGNTLVFIEVRQRDSGRYGGAAASVNRHKQQRLIRTARYFLPALTQRYFAGQTPVCRFDVFAIEPNGSNWIKQAFCVS